MITFEGTQHTGSFTGNTCIDQPLQTYLNTTQPPAAGLICSAEYNSQSGAFGSESHEPVTLD